MNKAADYVKITDTMLEAVRLYDEGYSVAEIAKRLNVKAQYVRWSMTIMGVPVDEMKYSPDKLSTTRFIRKWNEVTFPYKWNATTALVMRGLRADYKKKWRSK